jgi:hypothetical protein
MTGSPKICSGGQFSAASAVHGRFVQLTLIVLKEQSPLLYVRLVAIVKLSGVFAKPVLPVFTVPKDLQTLENV